jgi:hypothetical protein
MMLMARSMQFLLSVNSIWSILPRTVVEKGSE